MDKKLTIVFILTYLIASIIGVIIIHESAHFLGALAIGVPFNEIEVGFIGINPGITIPKHFSNAALWVFHYAGGFTAAFIFLCVYILIWYRRYRTQPSYLTWYFGAITMMVIGMQLGQGYVEGRFHAAYMFYAGSPISIISIFMVIFFAFSMYIHFQLFPITRNRE